MSLSAVLIVLAVAPGVYDGSQPEMATRLELKADGTFRFGLSYGALDERATGRWVEKDGRVLLTTTPAPKPPRFVAEMDVASADGRIYAAVTDPDAIGGFTLTLMVRYEGTDEVEFVEAEENGLVPVAAGKRVIEIVPDLPVFTIPYLPHALTPGGHRLTFRFERNDLGVADFAGEPLTIEGGALVMKRHERTIRFRSPAS